MKLLVRRGSHPSASKCRAAGQPRGPTPRLSRGLRWGESLYARCSRDFSSRGPTMAADGHVPRLWLPQSAGPSKVLDLLPLLQAHGSRPDGRRGSERCSPPPFVSGHEPDGRHLGVSGRSGMRGVGLGVHHRAQDSLTARSCAGAADETCGDTVGAGPDTRPDEGPLTRDGRLRPSARPPPNRWKEGCTPAGPLYPRVVQQEGWSRAHHSTTLAVSPLGRG
jgi:hypothetical protein